MTVYSSAFNLNGCYVLCIKGLLWQQLSISAQVHSLRALIIDCYKGGIPYVLQVLWFNRFVAQHLLTRAVIICKGEFPYSLQVVWFDRFVAQHLPTRAIIIIRCKGGFPYSLQVLGSVV